MSPDSTQGPPPHKMKAIGSGDDYSKGKPCAVEAFWAIFVHQFSELLLCT